MPMRWQLGQRLGLEALHVVDDQTEAVAQVYHRGGNAGQRLGGEHQARSLCLADTDAEEVYLKARLLLGDKRAYLEHVCLKD